MPGQDRHGEHRLRPLAVGLLDVAREEEVELLVGAAQLHVGAHRHRVVALQQRVEQLEDRDRPAAGVALGEVVALEQLGDGRGAREPEQVLHRHVEPLAVAANLGPLGVEDREGLAPGRSRRCVDLGRVQLGPVARAPARVAHAGGVVADDQDDQCGRGPGTRRSLRRTTTWPRWMSGAVGSIPSFTRSGRPSASLRSSAPSGSASDALRRSALAAAAPGSVTRPMLDCARRRDGYIRLRSSPRPQFLDPPREALDRMPEPTPLRPSRPERAPRRDGAGAPRRPPTAPHRNGHGNGARRADGGTPTRSNGSRPQGAAAARSPPPPLVAPLRAGDSRRSSRSSGSR